MQINRAFAKLVQLVSLPLTQWGAFGAEFSRKKVSGLMPCVLPGTRHILRVPLRDYEESYRFFAESVQGRRELGFFIEKLRPGDVLFDIGAFRGAYGAAAMAALGDMVEVHYFEPLATNLESLEALITANAFRQSTVVPKAVGDGREVAGTVGEDMMLRNSISEAASVFPSTSVDTYSSEAGCVPTVLKIDVEGFESEVIAGARKVLDDRKIRIWLELHPHRLAAKGIRWEEIIDTIQLLGYRTTRFFDYELPTRDLGFHVWCEPSHA